MEIRLRTKDEIEVFKVLVDSLKSDLNKTLVSIECDTPQAITSDNNKIEILKFFIEEFKNDQSSWDAQNCIDLSIYDSKFIDSLSTACALLSRIFLKTVDNAEKFFAHLKANMNHHQNQSSVKNANKNKSKRRHHSQEVNNELIIPPQLPQIPPPVPASHVFEEDCDDGHAQIEQEQEDEAFVQTAASAEKYSAYDVGNSGTVSSNYSESEDQQHQDYMNQDDDADEDLINAYDMNDNDSSDENANDYDSKSQNQTSTNSSLQENSENNMRTKSIYLTSHDGAKVLATYLIKKELIDTGVKNKRNSTLACRRQYLCMQCPYKEKSFTNFSTHLIGHIERVGVAKCRYCPYWESSRTKLGNHEKLHPEYDHTLSANSVVPSVDAAKKKKKEHATPLDDPTVARNQYIILEDENGESYETSYTSYKDYNTSKYNLFKNTAKRVYVCQQCPFTNTIFSLFKEHLLKHKFKKDHLQCKHCPFYETSKTKITHHESLHYNKATHDFSAGPMTRKSKA